MEFVLQDLRGMVGAYVDNILRGTDTLDDMLLTLREVYVRLAKQKLYANPEKCCFGQSEVESCGFIIGRNGIVPQPRKLMAVHVWPQLQKSTDVKSFLGLCGFYQRFVADYATVATPLTKLMWKKAVWKLGEEEERAFQALKVRLLQYPVLTVPNFKLPLIMYTDASDVGVGAPLSQKDEVEF